MNIPAVNLPSGKEGDCPPCADALKCILNVSTMMKGPIVNPGDIYPMKNVMFFGRCGTLPPHIQIASLLRQGRRGSWPHCGTGKG